MMLKFSRSKLTSVWRKSESVLCVHGVLEDDVYGMEVGLDLGLPVLDIRTIDGRWNRMENAECYRAIPFLQDVVGLRIEKDFAQKIQKSVGRSACRHFADLIIECCEAGRDAARIILEKDSETKRPDIGIDEYFGKTARPEKQDAFTSTPSGRDQREEAPRQAARPMVIDLHVHSAPASVCSSVTIEQLIEEARSIGLDGICLTDHNHRWNPMEVETMRQQHGFLILRANEITTDQGDILVIGLEEDIQGLIKLTDLRKKVVEAQGFMIAAHPFRGFLTFGIGYLGLTPQKASLRPVFQEVDAIEVMNSRVSEKENHFAAQVAEILRLPVIGGSDAHKPGEVGRFATRFTNPIYDEKGLIAALRTGRFSPVAFRES
jgi:predicted metal-dependent phosphoesterase TrpH